MGAFFGWNVNARALGGKRARLLTLVERGQPNMMLVMDDDDRYTLCQEIHARSPETLIVHRSTELDSYENKPWDAGIEAMEWVALVAWSNPPPYVIHQLFNEQGHFKQAHDYAIEAMKIAAEARIHLGILAWSFGSWYASEHVLDTDDQYDELWYALALHKGFHFLILHEYEEGLYSYITAGGQHSRDVFDLENPELVQPDKWTTPEEFVQQWRGNNRVGRFLFIVYRWVKKLKLPPQYLRILLGEAFMDVCHYPNSKKLADLGGVPQLRGMPTLQRYWEFLFKGRQTWDFETTGAMQVLHTAKLYRAGGFVEGGALYMLNYQEGEQSTHYNLFEYEKFQDMVVAERGDDVPVVTPTKPIEFPPDNASGWDTAVTTESGVRVREQPNLSANILMGLPKGTQLPANFAAQWLENDFRPVLFTQGRVHGYIHKDYLSHAAPPPEFDVTVALQALGRITVLNDAIVIHLNEMDTLMVEKTAKINELRTILEGLD